MARQLTGIDIAMIVTGCFMLILAISLFGVVGAMLDMLVIAKVANIIQFAVGGWYLLTSILAIVSGASGHKCPYISVIVLSVLAILIALAAGILAILVVVGLLSDEHELPIPSLFTTLPPFKDVPSKFDFEETSHTTLTGLPVGVVVINFISFILLIVISSLACCGTCCNSRDPVQHNTTIVTGGFSSAPPGYVTLPPEPQQHNFQGVSNPNYNTPPPAPYSAAI